MNILLVDNNTKHKKALNRALAEHEVETVFYHPGLKIDTKNKDLIILSGGGGQGNEINDPGPRGHLWYGDQMEFVKECDKPLIGICMGFEVICSAYGSKVEEMDEVILGYRELNTTKKGKEQIGKTKIKQYEAHKWHVKAVDESEFDVLAKSKTGVEVIKHKKKPIFATQFHPEIEGGSIKLETLVKSFS